MATVDVVFSHFAGNHQPGDRVTVDVEEARTLVASGAAQYATQPDAKQAGDDPEKARTSRKGS